MNETALTASAPEDRWVRIDELTRKAPAWLIPLLMLTLPLEFTATWFPNQLIQVGRITIVVILAVLLVEAIRRRVSLPALGLWLPPAVFVAYAGLSALATRSSPGLKTFGAALVYAFVALAIYQWTRSAGWQERLWLWYSVACIGLALITISQRVFNYYIWNPPTTGGLERFNATFADPNVLGRILTIMIVCGVLLTPMIENRRVRNIMTAAVLLSAASLPFTYSRQAWVIGGVALVLALVTSLQRRYSVALAVVALVIFVAVTLSVPSVQSRFGLLRQNLTGAPTHMFETFGLAWLNYLPLDSERHYLIAAGLQMFYDHPILGVGFGNFPAEILGPYRGFIESGYTTSESHTSIVTIMAELGLVGLAIAVWWLFEYVRRSILAIRRSRANSPYVMAPLLAVGVILLESQLNARLVDEPYFWIFLGAAWSAMGLAGAREARASQPAETTMTAATSQNSTARSFFQ